MELIDILRACPDPDDDAIDFGMFCRELRANKPAKGDGQAWAEMFALITNAEEQGLITTEREGRNLVSIQLTDAGKRAMQEWKSQRSSRRLSL